MGASPPRVIRCPHSEQNFAVSEACAPHREHARVKGVAHSTQNFASERFMCRQTGHRIYHRIAVERQQRLERIALQG